MIPPQTRLWITGASGGIGRAVALLALQHGARVAASGRRADALASLSAGDNLLPLPFDVRDENAAHAAAAQIRARWGGLDWALLNAGDCEYMNPRAWDAALIRRVMEVNFFGVANCAAAALPLLAEARGGRGLLAAVSSLAAVCPLPRAAAYGASKAAVSHFVRALEAHYPQTDICLVQPGFVRTPLTDRNDFSMPWLMEADDAAAVILRGMAARRDNVVFPRRLAWTLKILARLPRRARRAVWARMMQA